MVNITILTKIIILHILVKLVK